MSTTATAWPWATDRPQPAAAPPAGEGSLLSKFGSGRTPDGTRLIRAFGLSRLEVAQLAATDFPNPDLPFRRVSIDPVRSAAVMMAPSRLHERIAERLDKVAEGLGGDVPGGGLRVEQLRASNGTLDTSQTDCDILDLGPVELTEYTVTKLSNYFTK